MKYIILSLLAFMGMTMQAYSNDSQDMIDAYIYGFPLVIMDVTKDVLTATPTLTETKAPINQFLNKKTFPDPSFKEVVSPNADTLYSQAWLDLSKEPLILSVPDTGKRYYLFPMLDAWTNVFFSPGTRTTGNGKGAFAITGPKWQGTLPDGVKEVKSPSNLVWIIGRIQTNGPSDYAAVNDLQAQFKLTPLSAWGTDYTPPKTVTFDSKIDAKTPPIEQVLNMDGATFFKRLAQLLKNTPVPSVDSDYVKRFSSFGLIPGKDFTSADLSTQQIQDLNESVQKAQVQIQEYWKKLPFAVQENGWSAILKGVGSYGTDYITRATVALAGLGANLPEDAIYPYTIVDSNGQTLNGKYRYTIHFDKGSLPPVNAFWSITMYDNAHFFIQNPINRYAIGSKDQLTFNSDGSLDIYIQNESPGKDKESNWLPAPDGDFNLILRLYAPRKEILDGMWKPPAVKKVN